MTAKINLAEALATFGDIYSPRIVGRVNDYDVRVAHVSGEHVWHTHERTDEFFLVIDGRLDVALREPGGPERTVELGAGDIFVVPRGGEPADRQGQDHLTERPVARERAAGARPADPTLVLPAVLPLCHGSA